MWHLIDTLPRDFGGFVWLLLHGDAKPVLAYVVEGRFRCAECAGSPMESAEWYREDKVVAWAAVVSPCATGWDGHMLEVWDG